MRDSKLISLLKSLDPSDFRRLKKLIRSPFFTTNANLVKLYDCLGKHYPEFDSPKLEKEIVFQSLFPNRRFNSDKIQTLMNEMTRLTDEYLLLSELRQNKFQRKKILVDSYGRRQLYDLFQKGTKDLLRDLENLSQKDAFYFLEKQSILQNAYLKIKALKLEDFHTALNAIMENLDNYFIHQKLLLSSSLKSSEHVLNEKHSIKFIEAVVKEARGKNTTNDNYFSTLLNVFELTYTDSENAYWEAKANFFNSFQKMSRDDQQYILRLLSNYAVHQVNKGEHRFRYENLELYKFGLDKMLFLENGRLPDIIYTNIASYGASLKEFEWTEKFILDYEPFLDESVRTDAKHLGLGYFYFFKKDYSQTIDLLINYHFSKIFHAQRAKSLLLRSYFELSLEDDSYYELFDYYSRSFEKFFRRDKINSQEKCQVYLNFISMLRKIARYKYENKLNSELKKKLIIDIQQKPIVVKPWLLERLHKL